jgi:hypothetical protein
VLPFQVLLHIHMAQIIYRTDPLIGSNKQKLKINAN